MILEKSMNLKGIFVNTNKLKFDNLSDLRLFKSTCVIIGLYFLWIAIENLLFRQNITISVLFFLLSIGYIGTLIFYPSKTLNFFNTNWFFYSLAFLCLNIGFIFHGGFLSPILYLLFPFLLFIIYANKRQKSFQIIFLILANLLILYLLNLSYPGIALNKYFENWIFIERIAIHISILIISMLIINDLFKKYEIAKNQAKDSEKAKEAFLENMSHLIRTPINAINGYSELLTDENVPEFEKKIFKNRILINAKNLHKMIFNLVDLSIIQESSLKLREYRFKLSDIIYSLNNRVNEEIKNKEKNIKYQYYLNQKDANTYLILDGDRISQMIWNLLENSIYYTENGTIELIITINFNNEFLEFIIKDTGIGMASSLLDRIHKQSIIDSNKSTTANPKPGMGINISKGIVEAYNGNMEFISKINHGTQVSIYIPIHQKYEKLD